MNPGWSAGLAARASYVQVEMHFGLAIPSTTACIERKLSTLPQHALTLAPWPVKNDAKPADKVGT